MLKFKSQRIVIVTCKLDWNAGLLSVCFYVFVSL